MKWVVKQMALEVSLSSDEPNPIRWIAEQLFDLPIRTWRYSVSADIE